MHDELVLIELHDTEVLVVDLVSDLLSHGCNHDSNGGITTPLTSSRVSAKSTTAGVAPFVNMVVALSINGWMAGFLDLSAIAKDLAALRIVARRSECMLTVKVAIYE